MSVHQQPPIEHVDVLIIGGGLSGIGAAYYLQRDLPGKRYAILEAREASGGTWGGCVYDVDAIVETLRAGREAIAARSRSA